MMKENFIKLFENSFKENWDLPALTAYSENHTILYKDLARDIALLHLFFEKNSIKRGDRIALVGRNNTHWCILYMATITYGAIAVPILQDFHPDNIHHIVNHSESKLLFTSDQIWENLDESQMPFVRGVFSLNTWKCHYGSLKENFNGYAVGLTNEFSAKYPTGFTQDDIRYAEVDNSEVILINYTSGTTGFSKGVMLTGNNMAGNVIFIMRNKLLKRGDKVVSFLPLAHAYGCTLDLFYTLATGVHVVLLGKTPSPKILLQAFAEHKPNHIVTVPLVIEKIYKKLILPQLSKVLDQKPQGDSLVFDKEIGEKVKLGLTEAFGGNFNQVIIGGAALNKEVESFLHKIGFPFTVGYGMTECGPLISFSPHELFAPTSCGHVLDGIMEVRIDSSDPFNIIGEVQVRGENVMKGYYKNEEASKDVFTDDGWLKTGDLGTIDKENRIYLRGRSKSMILGASGQNIFPEEIEAKLNNLPYVMESLVVNKEGKLHALVYPDYEAMDAAGLSSEDLVSLMEKNRIKLNNDLSSYESVSSVSIYPNEFEKTPKKSIKRYLYNT